jgi:hypothetical protein
MLPTLVVHLRIVSCLISTEVNPRLRFISGERESAFVSLTVTALEEAYADADLVETIC